MNLNFENILSLVIPVVLALGGYLFTYFYGRRQEQRRNRLERINRQLDKLYGPMLAIVQSSQQAWECFLAKHNDNPKFYKKESNPTPEEVAEFHKWMATVFIPNNEELYSIITQNTSLMVEDEIPPVLLDLFAHIMEFKINFMERKSEHDEVAESERKYNGQDLLCYCEDKFRELKTEQIEIIRKGR